MWLALQASSYATAADPPVVLTLHCAAAGAAGATSTIEARVPVRVAVTSDSPAWVEMIERGRDVLVDSAAAINVTVPIRYGRIWVPVEKSGAIVISPAVPTGMPTPLDVTIHCEPIAAAPNVEWMRRIASAASQMKPPIAELKRQALVAEADALTTLAPTRRDRALALHLRAQILFFAEQTADAAAAFAGAENAWRSAGDMTRATIARTGLVEELQRLGRYDEILDLAAETRSDTTAESYFAARIEAASCVSLRYLAKLPSADSCFADVVANFQRMHEPYDFVNALLDRADVQRYAGNTAAAATTARRAADEAQFADMEVYRGRALLMLADIDMTRGAISTSLQRYDEALSSFATAHASRWESNAMLRAASLYSEIGASDEAYALADTALARLPVRDAPARVAAALVTLARIDFLVGRYGMAQRRLEQAIGMYGNLAMTAEADIANLLLARVLDATGHVEELRERLRTVAPALINRTNWELLSAADAARNGQCARAIDLLPSAATTLSLSQRIETARVRALCAYEREGNDAAQRSLRDDVARIQRVQAVVGNPLLQRILSRRMAPLLRLGIELELRDDPRRTVAPDAARLWHWAAIDAPVLRGNAATADIRAAEAFDSAVAEALFAPPVSGDSPKSRAARMLLGYLGSAEGAGESLRHETLATVQARLAPDTLHLVVVDGGAQVAAIWIAHNAVDVVPVKDVVALRDAAIALSRIAGNAATPIGAINGAAERVSGLLLHIVPTVAAPAHLVVHADGVFASLPWSLLTWGETGTSLVDTSRISLVRPVARSFAAAPGMGPQRIVVATFPGDATTTLPLLQFADTEPELIGQTLRTARSLLHIDVAFDRNALLAALDRSDGWVHVAAHGAARPMAVAQSGILAARGKSEGTGREFVGIADILSRRIAAPLVVLNACYLADTRADGDATGFSFADALLVAGAGEVVAALWPVSDAAGSVWIEAFYTRLIEPDHDASAAVSEAQRRLRRSRAFRHPFYWASLVHLVPAT